MDYERFGPYVIHECLGAGGMATVHRATLDIGGGMVREVALKRLLPQLADDKQFVADFVREAKIAAQLRHPNIVSVLELGREGTQYFMAMELVHGKPLYHLMRWMHAGKQTAPLGVFATLLIELCDALDYAANAVDDHGDSLRIVHRDLTPSNLLVTEDGHLKIIDFGVAKSTSEQFRTFTGMVKGKLGYMSPEAVSGQPLDHRSDLFSLGVVGWELLAGRRLFKGANEFDIVKRIRDGEVHPPSTFNPAVTRDVDALVMRALARPREQRWPTAAQLRTALEPILRANRGTADINEWKSRLSPTMVTKLVEDEYDVEVDSETTESNDLAVGSVREEPFEQSVTLQKPKGFLASDTVVSKTRTDDDG